ncbi:MAG TPA: biotin--[acetyl-CoA-carboxylase] ligase [Arcobacter sp.]|nr:biotin--[acetyl-CoA-carboxylase] ligase [Arcobacter sp.]
MKLIYLESVDSTQTYLKDYIKKNKTQEIVLVYTHKQTNGIGSRDNRWDGKSGNLFFSFSILKKDLPFDLPLSSASIYFSFILKILLKRFGSSSWIKWPNDLYINEKKLGGTITHMDNKYLYCGIGINTNDTNDNYGYLDIEIDSNKLLNEYINMIKNKQAWKEIFSQFQVEFHISKKYKTTIDNQKTSMENAILNDDGSIEIDGKKVYSLR